MDQRGASARYMTSVKRQRVRLLLHLFVSKRIQKMISRRWLVSKYTSLRQSDTTHLPKVEESYSDIEKDTKEAPLSSAYIYKKRKKIINRKETLQPPGNDTKV